MRSESKLSRLLVPPALRVSALLLLGALPAAAQQDPMIKLDSRSRLAVDQTMDSLRQLGLSDAPLRSVALQGIRKGADNGKIVERVRQKFASLKTAFSILGKVSDDEIDAASTVLEAGAKPAQLAVFKTRQNGRSDLEAFTIWADLIYRGVPGEEASSAITKLWQDGADGPTYRRLWNDVQTDISQGLNPGAALQARVREAPIRPTAKSPTTPEGEVENQRSR
jgi:hypothetical protein